MFETWVQMTDLLKSGKLNLEPLFAERLPLERFADAFSLFTLRQAQGERFQCMVCTKPARAELVEA